MVAEDCLEAVGEVAKNDVLLFGLPPMCRRRWKPPPETVWLLDVQTGEEFVEPTMA